MGNHERQAHPRAVVSASVSSTRSSACSQAGILTPNVSASFSHDKTEFTGRLAGSGYSLAAIGMSFGHCACLLKNAFANPNQVVAPEFVR